MTAKRKNEIETAVKNADIALMADGEKAFAKAAESVAMAEKKKPEPKAKAAKQPKAPKEPKEKKLAASAIEVDVTEFKQKHSKYPGTGKQDKDAIWRFQIGPKAVEFATMFFRDAKAEAIAKAIETKVSTITVLA